MHRSDAPFKSNQVRRSLNEAKRNSFESDFSEFRIMLMLFAH